MDEWNLDERGIDPALLESLARRRGLARSLAGRLTRAATTPLRSVWLTPGRVVRLRPLVPLIRVFPALGRLVEPVRKPAARWSPAERFWWRRFVPNSSLLGKGDRYRRAWPPPVAVASTNVSAAGVGQPEEPGDEVLRMNTDSVGHAAVPGTLGEPTLRAASAADAFTLEERASPVETIAPLESARSAILGLWHHLTTTVAPALGGRTRRSPRASALGGSRSAPGSSPAPDIEAVAIAAPALSTLPSAADAPGEQSDIAVDDTPSSPDIPDTTEQPFPGPTQLEDLRLSGLDPTTLIAPLALAVRRRASRAPASVEAGTFEPTDQALWWSDTAVTSPPGLSVPDAALRAIGAPAVGLAWSRPSVTETISPPTSSGSLSTGPGIGSPRSSVPIPESRTELAGRAAASQIESTYPLQASLMADPPGSISNPVGTLSAGSRDPGQQPQSPDAAEPVMGASVVAWVSTIRSRLAGWSAGLTHAPAGSTTLADSGSPSWLSPVGPGEGRPGSLPVGRPAPGRVRSGPQTGSRAPEGRGTTTPRQPRVGQSGSRSAPTSARGGEGGETRRHWPAMANLLRGTPARTPSAAPGAPSVGSLGPGGSSTLLGIRSPSSVGASGRRPVTARASGWTEGLRRRTPASRLVPAPSPSDVSTAGLSFVESNLLDRLPERPGESTDDELTQVIMGLPAPMASAAIAAGVLSGPRTVAPTPSRTPSAPPSAWPDLVVGRPGSTYAPTDLVLAPVGGGPPAPDAVSPSAAHDGLSSAPEHSSGDWSAASGASMGDSSLRASATSTADRAPIQRAPLDRPVSRESSAPAGPPDRGSGPGDAPGAPDLDHLTDEVYDRLRWRLAAERERSLGWG